MTYLTNIHPQLPTVLLAVLVGGIVYGLRLWRPAIVDRLPPQLQSLPAILVATALGAIPMALGASTPAETFRIVLEAVLVAIGGHHAAAKWVLPQPEKKVVDTTGTEVHS